MAGRTPSCPAQPALSSTPDLAPHGQRPHNAITSKIDLSLVRIGLTLGPQPVSKGDIQHRVFSNKCSLRLHPPVPCSLTPQPPPPLCVARLVAGSPVRAPCCACSVPARAPVEERGTLALELGPPPPQPRLHPNHHHHVHDASQPIHLLSQVLSTNLLLLA